MEHLGPLPYILLHTIKGKRHERLVGRRYWTIGRGKDNEVIIPDRCISRRHAILQGTAAGEINLIDLGSRNGTFVNDRRVIIPVTLQDGDRVTFGNTQAEFYCPLSPAPEQISLSLSTRDVSTIYLRKRCLISVAVVDIRDFTLLARQLDDNTLSKLMGNWFRQVGDAMRQAGSWVDKYIGDAVMVIWFHGQADGNDGLKVTQEQLIQIFQGLGSLHQIACKLNSNLQDSLPFPLRIGVGLNTGLAMVGNPGSGDRPDYTALGDTVNAAFRLESATKEIQTDLAIGEGTYSHLSDWTSVLPAFERYAVNLKGYGTSTTIYGTTFAALDRCLTPLLQYCSVKSC